jgi:hypothetical protein
MLLSLRGLWIEPFTNIHQGWSHGKNLPSGLPASLGLFRFQWIAHAAIFPKFVPKGSDTDAQFFGGMRAVFFHPGQGLEDEVALHLPQ